MGEHTNPLYISDDVESEIVDGDGVRFAATYADSSGVRAKRARRLVACWNACEGMPTDDLKLCPPKGLFHLADFSNETVKQCAELAEALEAVMSLPDAVRQLELLDRGIGTATQNAAWLKARAALAKHRQPEEAPELFPGTLDALRDLWKKEGA